MQNTTTEILKAYDELPWMRLNRLELIRDLGLKLKAEKIGIANCVMYSREAEILKIFFSKTFTVYSVDCKYGNLRRENIFRDGSRGTLCNPSGQAEYLNRNNCDINISVGLCVGHDMIFNRESNALVTTLFTKDFTNNDRPDKAVESVITNI